jgi:xylulokinase
MEKKYVLSFDHGTSGMKTAIVSTEGKVMGFDVEEYGLQHPAPGAVEQDPMDWWQALVNTTHNLLVKELVPVKDIVACTTSNQMSGTIPVDREGRLLHNCMTWMDTRGAPSSRSSAAGSLKFQGTVSPRS